MTKYRVAIKECHISVREVEADNPKDALQKALEDLDTEIDICYSHTLEDGHMVTEIEDNGS